MTGRSPSPGRRRATTATAATPVDLVAARSSPAIFDFVGASTSESAWPDRFGVSLRRELERARSRPLRTLSLFSGAGGLDVGFHDAGFDILDAVEIDAQAAATLRANVDRGRFGECRVHCVDIHDFRPPGSREYDFLIGGPPCQSFSAAGRRASGVPGLNDARGTLFEEYVRILRDVRPAGFLFENVYGITGANGGKAWRLIVDALADAGYSIFHRVLDAADFGVPQHRERLIIVGVRDGQFRFPRPTHGPDAAPPRAYYAAGRAIEGSCLRETAVPELRGRYGPLLRDIPPGLNYSFYTEEMGHPQPVFAWRSKFSDFLYKADPDVPVRTIKAQGGQYTGPFHWDSRVFSVGELKRLQTFPDEFAVLGGRGAQIRQIGNSVPPQLARVLAIAVRQQVFGDAALPTLDSLNADEVLGFRRRKRLLTDVYRRKAGAAIAASTSRPRVVRTRRLSWRSLGEDFSWGAPRGAASAIRVEFVRTSAQWLIVVAPGDEPLDDRQFEIHVEPVGDWPLTVRSVRLRGPNTSPRYFTAAWKAFDEELARRDIKADVVQLCGYYQYEPKIRARLETGVDASPVWRLLAAVCAGASVRATLDARSMARAWDVGLDEVESAARELKSLGYEVRNRSTNSEIPAGHYLVPYAFPTLTHRSVQLHKALA